MSSQLGSEVGRAASSTRTVRVLQPPAVRLACLALVIAGPVGVIAALWSGWWPVAIVAAVLPLIAAKTVGWVEVADDRFVDRRLMGESTELLFDDVREVGIGMHQIRKTKVWYPEISTISGQSVKFQTLTSTSGQATIGRVEEMYRACKAKLPVVPDEKPIEAVSVGADGELEFAIAPGYESYLREKAAEEAAVADALPLPVPEPIAPAPEPAPAPRLLVAVESPPDIGEIDEEPEVFEPAPLQPVKKKTHLTLVPDPVEEESEAEQSAWSALKPTPVPPPIPQAPPTVIEKPKTLIEQPKSVIQRVEAEGASRQFTSLFSRES